MKAQASNIPIKELIAILSQMNLKFDSCKIIIDEDRNRVQIMASKPSEDEEIEEKETDDLISLDGINPEDLI